MIDTGNVSMAELKSGYWTLAELAEYHAYLQMKRDKEYAIQKSVEKKQKRKGAKR